MRQVFQLLFVCATATSSLNGMASVVAFWIRCDLGPRLVKLDWSWWCGTTFDDWQPDGAGLWEHGPGSGCGSWIGCDDTV